MKTWKLYILIIILSSFPLINILTTPGVPHTSDGLMHIARSAAFYKELIGGQFPVRWASQFDYGYGTPIFNFFNPLPYFVGAVLIYLGFSLVLVLKMGFVITYILTGIFMLMFSLFYFKDKKTAVLATIMYQYAPFRLVEMLVRGDLGSLYSYMILPLVFYAIVRFVEKNSFSRFSLLAFTASLLPLGHNINGFIFFGLCILFIPFATQNIKTIFKSYFAFVYGLLLAGFFVIPALFELKYTNGYIFSKDLFYQHFPPLYKLILPNITNSPSLRVAEVSVQIGLFHVLALAILIYLLLKNKFKGKIKLFAFYIILVSFVTLLFMQPITKLLWENISKLRQFQFPWRFLGIIIFTSTIAGALSFQKIPFLMKKWVYILLLFLIIISTAYYWRPYQGYQIIRESYYMNFPGSTNYFAEVNTIWMAHEPTEYPKKRIDIVSGESNISSISLLPEKHNYTVDAKVKSSIVDRTYFYPGWKVMVDDNLVPIQFQDQNYRGLITFNVPKGKHRIQVWYAEDQIQKIGNIISILAIVILFIGIFISSRQKTNEKNNK